MTLCGGSTGPAILLTEDGGRRAGRDYSAAGAQTLDCRRGRPPHGPLHSCSLGIILVDQHLKLGRKLRIGSADGQTLEKRSPRLLLFASIISLDQPTVCSTHRRTSRSLRLPSGSILERTERSARQEKPVRRISARFPIQQTERKSYGDGDDSAAACGTASLRESLLQTKQTALDLNRPLTAKRS